MIIEKNPFPLKDQVTERMLENLKSFSSKFDPSEFWRLHRMFSNPVYYILTNEKGGARLTGNVLTAMVNGIMDTNLSRFLRAEICRVVDRLRPEGFEPVIVLETQKAIKFVELALKEEIVPRRNHADLFDRAKGTLRRLSRFVRFDQAVFDAVVAAPVRPARALTVASTIFHVPSLSPPALAAVVALAGKCRHEEPELAFFLWKALKNRNFQTEAEPLLLFAERLLVQANQPQQAAGGPPRVEAWVAADVAFGALIRLSGEPREALEAAIARAADSAASRATTELRGGKVGTDSARLLAKFAGGVARLVDAGIAVDRFRGFVARAQAVGLLVGRVVESASIFASARKVLGAEAESAASRLFAALAAQFRLKKGILLDALATLPVELLGDLSVYETELKKLIGDLKTPDDSTTNEKLALAAANILTARAFRENGESRAETMTELLELLFSKELAQTFGPKVERFLFFDGGLNDTQASRVLSVFEAAVRAASKNGNLPSWATSSAFGLRRHVPRDTWRRWTAKLVTEATNEGLEQAREKLVLLATSPGEEEEKGIEQRIDELVAERKTGDVPLISALVERLPQERRSQLIEAAISNSGATGSATEADATLLKALFAFGVGAAEPRAPTVYNKAIETLSSGRGDSFLLDSTTQRLTQFSQMCADYLTAELELDPLQRIRRICGLDNPLATHRMHSNVELLLEVEVNVTNAETDLFFSTLAKISAFNDFKSPWFVPRWWFFKLAMDFKSLEPTLELLTQSLEGLADAALKPNSMDFIPKNFLDLLKGALHLDYPPESPALARLLALARRALIAERLDFLAKLEVFEGLAVQQWRGAPPPPPTDAPPAVSAFLASLAALSTATSGSSDLLPSAAELEEAMNSSFGRFALAPRLLAAVDAARRDRAAPLAAEFSGATIENLPQLVAAANGRNFVVDVDIRAARLMKLPLPTGSLPLTPRLVTAILTQLQQAIDKDALFSEEPQLAAAAAAAAANRRSLTNGERPGPLRLLAASLALAAPATWAEVKAKLLAAVDVESMYSGELRVGVGLTVARLLHHGFLDPSFEEIPMKMVTFLAENFTAQNLAALEKVSKGLRFDFFSPEFTRSMLQFCFGPQTRPLNAKLLGLFFLSLQADFATPAQLAEFAALPLDSLSANQQMFASFAALRLRRDPSAAVFVSPANQSGSPQQSLTPAILAARLLASVDASSSAADAALVALKSLSSHHLDSASLETVFVLLRRLHRFLDTSSDQTSRDRLLASLPRNTRLLLDFSQTQTMISFSKELFDSAENLPAKKLAVLLLLLLVRDSNRLRLPDFLGLLEHFFTQNGLVLTHFVWESLSSKDFTFSPIFIDEFCQFFSGSNESSPFWNHLVMIFTFIFGSLKRTNLQRLNWFLQQSKRVLNAKTTCNQRTKDLQNTLVSFGFLKEDGVLLEPVEFEPELLDQVIGLSKNFTYFS